jgi:putative drug exporter of the RND superfamily
MIRLARWCFEHRRKVVAGWLLAVVVVLGLSVAASSRFNSNFSLPHTDSQAAVSLLAKDFPAASGEGDQVVIQATHGATVRSASVKAAVSTALAKVARVPGVQAVGSPYSAEGAAQMSRDGTVAFATVTWDKTPAEVTSTDAKNLIAAAETADGASLHISLGGEAISDEEGAWMWPACPPTSPC